MSRVKPPRSGRVKKILKLAKGYRGRSKNCYRIAKQRVHKALQYSYKHISQYLKKLAVCSLRAILFPYMRRARPRVCRGRT